MRLLISFFSLLMSTQSLAWNVDADHSDIKFISIKNHVVAEIHSFANVSGNINDEGSAVVEISLGSVQTKVDIRNERMKKHLFETDKYPLASISANVKTLVDSTAIGTSTIATVPASISLHGVSQDIDLKVRVIRLSESEMIVSSVDPVLIRASQFDLSDGIKKLSNLVGDIAIIETVPVSFSLVFSS